MMHFIVESKYFYKDNYEIYLNAPDTYFGIIAKVKNFINLMSNA